MRILYGVTGEGMGHAIRSSVVIRHLMAEGHEVEIVASSRAAEHMKQRFGEVHTIHGFHIVTRDNRVRRSTTALSNIVKGTAALPGQIKTYFELTEDFSPEVVISDFESWTSLYGERHRIPVFSVDNMQIIDRCRHAPEILAGHRSDFEIARAFVRGKLPFSERFLVTTFFYPPLKRGRTELVPPILRREIVGAEVERGEHLLVYQASEQHGSLIAALEATGLECRIYGMRRDLEEEEVEGTLRYRPFSEESFVEDLRTARGVVASAGFTLMSECVYLHKPLLAVPLGGQFEQMMNARYLEAEGYGMCAESADEDSIVAFVNTLPQYEEALEGYIQKGNSVLFETLDAHLDKAAAGLYEIHPRIPGLDKLKGALD